jgi:hypothetical protein
MWNKCEKYLYNIQSHFYLLSVQVPLREELNYIYKMSQCDKGTIALKTKHHAMNGCRAFEVPCILDRGEWSGSHAVVLHLLVWVPVWSGYGNQKESPCPYHDSSNPAHRDVILSEKGKGKNWIMVFYIMTQCSFVKYFKSSKEDA